MWVCFSYYLFVFPWTVLTHYILTKYNSIPILLFYTDRELHNTCTVRRKLNFDLKMPLSMKLHKQKANRFSNCSSYFFKNEITLKLFHQPSTITFIFLQLQAPPPFPLCIQLWENSQCFFILAFLIILFQYEHTTYSKPAKNYNL